MIPVPNTGLVKTLEFLSNRSIICSMKQLGVAPGYGLVTRKIKLWLEAILLRRAENEENDCSYLHDKASIKILKVRDLKRFLVGKHMEIQRMSQFGEGMEIPYPSPCHALCFSSIWLFLSIFFYIINWWSSEYNVPLSFLSHSCKLIKPKEGGGHGNLWFIASWSEAHVITWVMTGICVVGQYCKTEPFQGCQTHFHQGPHQPCSCFQRSECNFRAA